MILLKLIYSLFFSSSKNLEQPKNFGTKICSKSLDGKHEIDPGPFLDESGGEQYMCIYCGSQLWD